MITGRWLRFFVGAFACATLLFALPVSQALATEEGPGAAAKPAPAKDPWAGPDEPDFHDDGDVAAFESPHVRIGLHPHAGIVIGDFAGGFGGLELLLGTRIWRDFSLLTRLNADLGAWDAPSGSLFLSGSAGLGGEYVLQGLAGPGTGLALGLTVDAWLRGACQSPSCLRTLLPTATAHVGLLFNGSHEPTATLSAFSLGVSGGAGYDPVAETMAGRIGIYFGYEMSDRLRLVR